MTSIITKDLLERYLRAKHGDINATDCTDEMIVAAIARMERRSMYEICASLGLCAAAERFIGDRNDTAALILRDAWIDPIRWFKELAERGGAQGTPPPPAPERASDRDDTAAPLDPLASSGASPIATPGAAEGFTTAGKTPEQIASELVLEPEYGAIGGLWWSSIVERGAGNAPRIIVLHPVSSKDGADFLVENARGIIARLVARVRAEGRETAGQMCHRWIVFIQRDGGHIPTTHAAFDDENEALRFYDEAATQWSDSYLCKVVKGPAV